MLAVVALTHFPLLTVFFRFRPKRNFGRFKRAVADPSRTQVDLGGSAETSRQAPLRLPGSAPSARVRESAPAARCRSSAVALAAERYGVDGKLDANGPPSSFTLC